MERARKTGCDRRGVREARDGKRKDHGRVSNGSRKGKRKGKQGCQGLEFGWGPDARVRSEVGQSREREWRPEFRRRSKVLTSSQALETSESRA